MQKMERNWIIVATIAIVVLLFMSFYPHFLLSPDSISTYDIQNVNPIIDLETDEKLEKATVDISEPIKETEHRIEIPISEKNISMECKEFRPEGLMPFHLYSPSTKNKYEKLPLIIWLHGSGEVNANHDYFMSNGLPAIFNNWKFDWFNAYVVCPNLGADTGIWTWKEEKSAKALSNLIKYLEKNYNIDSNRISICGHSLGGQGTLYMASALPNIFSCASILSGYDCNIDISNISIPMIAQEGSIRYGESKISYQYMFGKFSSIFGSDIVKEYPCSHGDLPEFVFNLDADGDNQSDLIEWLLSHSK